jgi:hypothetical protein
VFLLPLRACASRRLPTKDTKEYSHNETEFLKLEILTTNKKKASISTLTDRVKEDIETLIKLLRVYSPE